MKIFTDEAINAYIKTHGKKYRKIYLETLEPWLAEEYMKVALGINDEIDLGLVAWYLYYVSDSIEEAVWRAFDNHRCDKIQCSIK